MSGLETITGVAGLVVIAIQAAHKLADLVSEARDVPDDIRDLGTSLKSLASILDSAKVLCTREEFQDVDSLLVENLRQCIQQCGVTSQSLHDELKRFKLGATGTRNPARRVAWIWHKTERQRLKTRLFESRDNLDTAILVMNGYMSGKGYHLIRSDIAALYEVLDRSSSSASRAERYRFRRQIEDDLRTVTDDHIDDYLEGLTGVTIPDAAPEIESIPDDAPESQYLSSINSQSSLIRAVSAGDQQAVQEILLRGGPLTPRSPEGQTALHVCVLYNERAIAELLLNHNSGTINITNMDGVTPIQLAMQRQSWSLACLLIERECILGEFPTMLLEAVRQQTGDLSSIRPVIRAIAKRLSNNTSPVPLVHLAIESDNLKALALLLEEGFDANMPEAETGIFPIQVAVLLERMDHVKLLLKHRASLNRHIQPGDNQVFRPYHDREYHKSEWWRADWVVSMLRVCVCYKSDQGPTMFRLLLDNGEEPYYGGTKSSAHLNTLCASNFFVYAEALINAGANVRGRDENGYTAMYWAANCNNGWLINLLLDKGADIDAQLEMSVGGYTPLHTAAMYNCFEAAKILIERGANVQLADAMGLTALQVAANQGDSHQRLLNMMKTAIEEKNTTQ